MQVWQCNQPHVPFWTTLTCLRGSPLPLEPETTNNLLSCWFMSTCESRVGNALSDPGGKLAFLLVVTKIQNVYVGYWYTYIFLCCNRTKIVCITIWFFPVVRPHFGWLLQNVTKLQEPVQRISSWWKRQPWKGRRLHQGLQISRLKKPLQAKRFVRLQAREHHHQQPPQVQRTLNAPHCHNSHNLCCR